MQRQFVSSSRISSVGWEPNTLEIQFKDGAIYQYSGVTESEYRSFMNSPSLGHTLSILDKQHPYRRV